VLGAIASSEGEEERAELRPISAMVMVTGGVIAGTVCRRSLRALSARGMGSDVQAVQMLTSSVVGRGWFATRRLRAGERVFAEAPIVASDLDQLARTVLDTPALREGLHMPASFPVRDNAPPTCSPEEWSKAMAQAGADQFSQVSSVAASCLERALSGALTVEHAQQATGFVRRAEGCCCLQTRRSSTTRAARMLPSTLQRREMATSKYA